MEVDKTNELEQNKEEVRQDAKGLLKSLKASVVISPNLILTAIITSACNKTFLVFSVIPTPASPKKSGSVLSNKS
mgnify:CR=1 FL=1